MQYPAATTRNTEKAFTKCFEQQRLSQLNVLELQTEEQYLKSEQWFATSGGLPKLGKMIEIWL